MIVRRRRFAGALVFAVSALAAVGCGSSSKTTTNTPSATSNGGSGKVAAFQQKINGDLAAAVATDPTRPPTSGPKAAAGKKVYLISCGNQLEGCARSARAAAAAASALGWSATSVDTQGDPTKAVAAIQQAIAAHANGIFIDAFDSNTIGSPVKQATAAGLKVAVINAVDTEHAFSDLLPPPSEFTHEGYLQGEELYHLTGGHLKLVIFSDDEFGVVKLRRLGTEQFISDCKAAGGDCQIVVKKPILAAQLATSVPSLAASIARTNPDANAFWAGYDAMPPFIIEGLKQAGASGKVIIGFDANKANIGIIKSGGMQKASTVLPAEWESYAALDNLNRLFSGQPAVAWAAAARLVDPSHPNPSTFTDFAAAYRKLWGR